VESLFPFLTSLTWREGLLLREKEDFSAGDYSILFANSQGAVILIEGGWADSFSLRRKTWFHLAFAPAILGIIYLKCKKEAMPVSSPEFDRPTSPKDYRVNFFRPQAGFMRSEVIYIWIALIAWALLTFGFQFLIYSGQTDASGSGPLTTRTIFSFPFEYWFTGQFLIVWFILICFLFNLMVDRLTERYRQRRQQ
jgi:putative solute:sodium symporter small subunit